MNLHEEELRALRTENKELRAKIEQFLIERVKIFKVSDAREAARQVLSSELSELRTKYEKAAALLRRAYPFLTDHDVGVWILANL